MLTSKVFYKLWPDDSYAPVDEIVTWKSDDYEIREAGFCNTCDEEIIPHYGEPFASCSCGTQEWYK